MNSCSHCREKLSEFLDEALQPNEREAVAAHLESCAVCAQIARELENLRATIREIAPLPAPASLRQNVRAALQNETKPRPIWAAITWRPAQFAWSGSAALAALTLMVLTRSFSPSTDFQAPQSQAPATKSAPEIATTKNENRVSTSSDTPAQAIKPQKITPQEITPSARQQKTRQEQFAAPPQPKKPTSNETDSSANAPIPIPNRAAPRRANSTPKISPRLSADSTKNEEVARNKQAISTKNEAESQTVNPPAPIRPKIAPLEKNSAPNTKVPREIAPSEIAKPAQDLALSEAAPRFTVRLQSVTAASIAQNKARPLPRANSASTMAAPDSTTEEESDNSSAMRDGAMAAEPLAAPNSATQSARVFRAPGALQKPVPNTAPVAPAIRDSASEIAPRKFAAVRRFRLQIEAPRDVKNAQIRLDLPPDVRLLWPASNVVWRGDFVAGKNVAVEFSLSDGRGGEEISLIVEQKTAPQQSKTLEINPLTLPR